MAENEIKVQWLTSSQAMHSYFEHEPDIQYTGGTLYEIDAIRSLQKKYNVSLNSHYVKKENFIEYYLKNHQKTIDGSICVTDPYVLAFDKLDYSKYNIAMIHHIDESLFRESLLGKLFLKRLLKNLKKVDKVVVVSTFWKNYLVKRGIKNIEIIYNSYNLNNFQFDSWEVNDLIGKLGLDLTKPSIYLGKYSKGKGVDEILDNINRSKYNLITSGKNLPPSGDIKSVYLSQREFPMLLQIADVVLAMSTMPEGWNRIAHEALLVKTPVIGSGTGGMRELLEKSGQMIMSDYSLLNQKIETCIKNKIQLGEKGYKFVKQFDENYFESCWLGLMSQIKTKTMK